MIKDTQLYDVVNQVMVFEKAVMKTADELRSEIKNLSKALFSINLSYEKGFDEYLLLSGQLNSLKRQLNDIESCVSR